MATKKFDFKKIGLKVAGVTAGAVAANALTKVLPASIDSKMTSAVQIAAGAILPDLLGKRNELLENIGNGMIAVGGMNLVSELTSKGVSGIFGNETYNYESRLMGDEDFSTDF